MKKTFVFLLCVALLFFFVPLPMSAAGTIQYKAILEPEPNAYELKEATSVTDAVYKPQFSGVVVYSLDANGKPPNVTDNFPDFNDKILILSDVTITTYIGCGELYLFGNAQMNTGNMIISGSSQEGTPKPALNEADLTGSENLQNALDGAEKKHTITGDLEIDYPLFVYDLEIEEGAIVSIKASGVDPNGIIASHSIVVHGSLIAEEGQTLEIHEGCNTVVGLTLYEDDGTTVFTNYGSVTETFVYRADEGKWVLRPVESPPIHFNDNHFQIRFDDFTPQNGQAPEVKCQIDNGNQTAVARDGTIQFFQNGDSTITSIAFSMKPAQFEDGNYEDFYRVRVTQGNAPGAPVEYNPESEELSFDSNTNTYSFTVTPVEKGSDYEGFWVDIFWTEEAYNSEQGGGGDPGSGGDPQNTYNLNLDYNQEHGLVMLDRFDGNGSRGESPGNYVFNEGSNAGVQIEPSQGYKIQEVFNESKKSFMAVNCRTCSPFSL